jgi:hypothetical protein
MNYNIFDDDDNDLSEMLDILSDNVIENEITKHTMWKSLYITNIDKNETIDSLSYKLSKKYEIGNVKKIIFEEKNTAFVYFYYWFNNNFTQNLIKEIQTNGKYDIYQTNMSDTFFIYINIVKNNTLSLDINQISDRIKYINEKMSMLSAKIIENNNDIDFFKEKCFMLSSKIIENNNDIELFKQKTFILENNMYNLLKKINELENKINN